jgi:hypothetical protein
MDVFRSRMRLPDCGWQEHEHSAPGELGALLGCIRSCVNMGGDIRTLRVLLGPHDITQQVLQMYNQQLGFTSSPTARIQSAPAEER